MRRFLVFLRGLQQRLRGDAADIEAGAAEPVAALDAGGLQAELRCADRRDVAARAGADDDDVVGVSHGRFLPGLFFGGTIGQLLEIMSCRSVSRTQLLDKIRNDAVTV